jgi:acyl carrier protein
MELDAAQLILAIEDEFCYEFDEDFWHHAKTFGDVVDEVRRRLAQKTVKEQDENEQTVLTELQEVLREMFPEQKMFDKDNKIARIIPYWKQSKYLTQLRQRFPELQWKNPRWIDFILFSLIWTFFGSVILLVPLCVLLTLAEAVFQKQIIPKLFYLVAGFASLGVFGSSILFMSIVSFSSPINTVGEGAAQIAEKRRQLKEWLQADESEFEDKLRKFFADVLGINPEMIRRESTLGNDLNIW